MNKTEIKHAYQNGDTVKINLKGQPRDGDTGTIFECAAKQSRMNRTREGLPIFHILYTVMCHSDGEIKQFMESSLELLDAPKNNRAAIRYLSKGELK